MKTQRFLNLLVVLALVLALLPVMAVSAAPAEKVDVCHFDKDTGVYFKINISENAFDSHVAHGDAAPGDWVPGMEGKKFAEDCSIVSVEKYTLIDTMVVHSAPAQTATYSNVTLVAGQGYLLEATGTYRFGNWAGYGMADAKCSHRPASVVPYIEGWVDGAKLNVDPLKAYGLQVSIYDGDFAKPLTPVGWVELCNLDHKYTATYVGTGSTLGLFIWDDQYSDNVGNITVNIYLINW